MSTEHYCERCGERLNPATMVALELNSHTGLYSNGGVPESESQGWFDFGKACAAKILKAGGENEQIRSKAR